MPPRIQRFAASVLLLALLPLLAAVAVVVRATSAGPVLHRATRISRAHPFTLYKFRTMEDGSERLGPAVTAAGDQRVTRVGRGLRRSRLDELPQLWNVLRGDMLLVGPRPEDPAFVDWADPLHQRVFGARPGITGVTALAFRREDTLLLSEASRLAHEQGRAKPGREDIDRAYRERILPEKLAMDAAYLERRSAREDLAILGQTLLTAIGRGPRPRGGHASSAMPPSAAED